MFTLVNSSFLDEVINDFFEKPNFWIGKEKNSYPMNVVKIIKNNDIYAYRLEYALAGFDKNEIKIHIAGDSLIIEAKKDNKEIKDIYEKEDYEFVAYNGISYRNLKTSFKLMDYADKNNIISKFENGLLKITIPVKKEIEDRTFIEIQ
jgi:HSP20 family molecular chaperone IbpA